MAHDRLERRNYRKVYQRLWKNPDFLKLPADLKVMTLYVLTGPQTNRVGLFQFSFAQAAETLGTTAQHVRSRLRTVCSTFSWHFDSRAQVLWLPSWWVFNPVSENPKNLKGYLTDLNDVPRTPLIVNFCNNLGDIPETLHAEVRKWEPALTPRIGDAITDPITDAITDPIGDRSTETYTGTCTGTGTYTETETVATPRSVSPPQPVRQAFEHYHRLFLARYHGKPEYAGKKDGKRMSDLLRKHGLEEVARRLDAFFASRDPWIQKSGHTLDVFFAAGTQTKLVAEIGRPTNASVSERTQQNLDARQRALQRINGSR